MTSKEFFEKYNGVGIDYDGHFGNQCMDLYRQYVKEVLELPQSPPVSGAVNVWDTYLQEHYDRLENTPLAVPQQGDIVIWGTGAGVFGHIAVVVSASVLSFTSFDQNWPQQGYVDSKGNYIGTGVCHYQKHNYNNVLGWLRPKADHIPPTDAVIKDDKAKIDLDKIGDLYYGVQELQAIKSVILAKDRRIKQLESELTEVKNNLMDELEKNTELKKALDKAKSEETEKKQSGGLSANLKEWIESVIKLFNKLKGGE